MLRNCNPVFFAAIRPALRKCRSQGSPLYRFAIPEKRLFHMFPDTGSTLAEDSAAVTEYSQHCNWRTEMDLPAREVLV